MSIFFSCWIRILTFKINIPQTGKLELEVDILSNHNMAMDIVVRWISYQIWGRIDSAQRETRRSQLTTDISILEKVYY